MIRRPLWLLGIAAVGVGAVVAAWVSQHVYGMQPCPWCVLQRLIFLAISASALLALLLPGLLRTSSVWLLMALAGCGAAAALWQHFVAASAASCDLTLADRIMGTLTLDALWPEVFMATASCADARAELFGLPYEAWSGALFVLLLAAGVRQLFGRQRRRR